MRGWLRRLRARIRYRHFDAELLRELDVHRSMTEDALRADGIDPREAQHVAARRLGNTLVARQAARGIWIAPWLDSVWQDVRYGARSLTRSPGFTITALLTLMLGIGVNTTLFSLVNALLLQPWPVPDAHRVVRIYHRLAGAGGDNLVGVSAAEMTFLDRQASSVDVAATRPVGGVIADGRSTRSVDGRLVSGNYFDVTQAPVAIGRALRRDDDERGRPPVVVISHELWISMFAGDATVVGRTIRFRDVPMTVVGVTRPGVRESALEGLPALWVPLSGMAALHPGEGFAEEFATSAAHCCVDLVGRLRPGMSRGRAEAELSVLDRRFRAGQSDRSEGMRVTGTDTASDPQAAKILPALGLFMAAALLVLMLTCANVGNLQLARAAARRREVTMRQALGAGRGRIVRQLLTEGIVLASTAVTLCLVVSPIVARAVMTRLEASLARALDFSPDGRVVMFAVGLTVFACVVSSLAPALRGTHHLVAGRTDRETMRVRSVFLAAQVAISVLLLTAAALLDRGLVRAASRDLGFRMQGLTAVEIARPPSTPARNVTALRTTMSAIGDRPIAVATALPLGDASFHTGVRKADEPEDADRQAMFQPVSANYFAVLRIALRAGRPFTDHAPSEVVVNETLARMLWPTGGAVGGYLAGAAGTPGRQVVGVVADAHLDGLGAVAPTIFQPADAVDHLVFNTSDIAADEVRALVTAVEPDATTNVRPVGDNIASSLESAALGARIAGGLGLLALAVAAVGITGVFSFAVTERMQEIGIRLALGASPSRVCVVLMRRAGRSTMVGAVIGLVLAVVGSPALRDFLYGLSPVNPGVYLAVTIVVMATGWVATIIPMRRALRVSPASALKQL